MNDQHQSYGDDGPAYGDDGPAYGDDGPAYGDEGPVGYAATATSEADDDAYSAPYDRYDNTVADDAGEDYVESSTASRMRGPGLARAAVAVAALLGLGGLGAAGYFFLLAPADGPGADRLSALQGVPVVGSLVGAPAAPAAGKAGSPALPAPVTQDANTTGIFARLFGPGRDPDDVIAKLEDNLIMAQRAIDTYYAGHHKLPSTTQAITEELRRMKLRPESPWHSGQLSPVGLGAMPTEPGAIAYLPKAGRYELRVGDRNGQPLRLNEVGLVLEGPNEATALADDGPAPVEEAAASAAADAAASSTGAAAKTKLALAAGVAGADKGASSPAITLANATPPPLPTVRPEVDDPGMVASPAGNLSPKDALGLKLKRNREFDYWRVRGISLVYSGRTEESLEAFKKALEIHPNDDSVTQWIRTINGVIDKSKAEALAKNKSENPAARRQAYRQPEPPRMPLPRPPVPQAPAPPAAAEKDDAGKMFDELRKADKVPLLAPPKLDP